MILHQGDILIKKSKGEHVYWLSERLLISETGTNENILHVNRQRYKKYVEKRYQNKEFLPDVGKSWRFAKTSHGFYYCYNNIPDRKPTFFKSKFGTLQDIKQALKNLATNSKSHLKEAIKKELQQIITRSIDNVVIRYYRYDSEVLFNDKLSVELAEALAWCQFIKLHYENDTYKKFGLQKKKDFLEVCAEILQHKQLEGLKVKSAEYLRHKINGFPSVGTLAQRNYLISNKYNNDNARIVGKSQLFDEETGEVFNFDAHQALIHYGYMNPYASAKLAGAKIYKDFYVPAIKEFGLEPIAQRTFNHHTAALHNRIKTARERHGKDYFKKHVQTYIPSEKLKYSHSLFAGDGSGTINYKYLYTDPKSGKTELKTRKLYVILISDVASRKIVGWAPAPKGESVESYEMLEKAVKMSMKNCDYQTMFEFVSDNHKAFVSKKSKQLLNTLFNKVRTIEIGNSQANPAEMEFKLFKQSLKHLKNFSSTSWGTGIEGQSNPDYFEIEQMPNYEDAVLQFYDIVKQWNESQLSDGTTPNQRFEVKHPKLAPIKEQIVRFIEGNHTKNDISKYRGFVQVSKMRGIERDTYLFEIPDYFTTGAELIAKNTGYEKNPVVKVVWTTEMADLYTLDGKFIMSCPITKKGHKSEAEATDDSKQALSHHERRKMKQEKALDEFELSLYEAYDSAFGVDDPMPYGHEMATGGNKESYNDKMENRASNSATNDSDSNVLSKKQRVNRDFDESENWD